MTTKSAKVRAPQLTLEALLLSNTATKFLPEDKRKHPMSEWIRRLGISRQHFYNVLTGRTQHPGDEIVQKFADVTGVSLETVKARLRGTRKAYLLTQ